MEETFVTYHDNGKTLEGYLSYDKQRKEPRPAIILCHAWCGRDDFVCEKARMMSEWGYVGFALDMYGKGVLGKSKEECNALMKPFMEDRSLLQRRVLIALQTLRQQPVVDVKKIAVIGFCFGGLCALDLARSGADVIGAVSMHGLLNKPENLSKQHMRAKVLALHGHDDPLVLPEQVAEFEKEMTDAGVDWQIHVYGKTMHAFTNPIANDPGFGTVYNPVSAQRAWKSTRQFFEEVF